jgi:hypothetical protein
MRGTHADIPIVLSLFFAAAASVMNTDREPPIHEPVYVPEPEFFFHEKPRHGDPVPITEPIPSRKIILAPRTQPPPQADASPQSAQLESAGNGRERFNARTGPWAITRTTDIDREMVPVGLLADKSRLLIHSVHSWALYDTDLRLISALRLHTGAEYAPTLDLERNQFYAPDADGDACAFSLATGKKSRSLGFKQSEQFGLCLISRIGNDQVLVSTMSPPETHHAVYDPRVSAIEVRTPFLGGLAGTKRKAILFRNTKWILAAVHGGTLILAAQDTVYLTGPDLKIKSAFTGDFFPEWMSVDEAGMIHLIIQDKASQRALWVLDLEGRLILSTPLKPDWDKVEQAPVIGYDHAIFLRFSRNLVAISPLGKILWEKESAHGYHGISATPDGALLVVEDSSLVRLGPDGTPRDSLKLPEAYLGPPARVLPDGDILVAGSDHLYRIGKK